MIRTTVSQKTRPAGCLIQATFLRTSLASRFYSAGLGHYCLYIATCLWCVCAIACRGPGEVILYYCYCQIKEPRFVCDWQNELCSKLRLTGKVNRVLFLSWVLLWYVIDCAAFCSRAGTCGHGGHQRNSWWNQNSHQPLHQGNAGTSHIPSNASRRFQGK